MSRGVSIVLPGLDDRALFERALPPLLAERSRHGMPVEILVVDDTGSGALASWIVHRFPEVAALALPSNEGFSAAALAGAQRARGEMLLLMNPDVRARPGFLAPLCAALEDERVWAASPRVLLFGDPSRIESANALAWADGRLRVEPRRDDPRDDGPRPTAFAIGGALLVRRADFLARGGFDPLFAPFYWEDVDLSVCAWRAGRRVVEVPASIVEHDHRGTIGPRVPEEIVHAAIEKNRHLLGWKHLTGEERARDTVQALLRDVVDATIADRRDELVHLCLAFEELDALARSRAALPAGTRALEEIPSESEPCA